MRSLQQSSRGTNTLCEPEDLDAELDEVRSRYARRESIPAWRYSPLNPEVVARVQERQRAMLALIRRAGWQTLAGRDVLEIGCGSGANMLELLTLGAEPARLSGNDLLPARLAAARTLLPDAVRLFPGEASSLPVEPASVDLILQFTVFSSLLDDALQARLANAMFGWLRPGGAVLWYDFTIDNPRNGDVRGVPLRRIRSLFPASRIEARRITLAPPIARALVRVHPSLRSAAAGIPFLRSHVLAWIAKPSK
jgi:SAM-dependent methyltransferase